MFAALAGLEQSPVLQLGIVFDITVWFVISTMFVSMIYRHFGSLDVTNMKKLKG
jgi:hydrogenase-4 membrane subunit HyfE